MQTINLSLTIGRFMNTLIHDQGPAQPRHRNRKFQRPATSNPQRLNRRVSERSPDAMPSGMNSALPDQSSPYPLGRFLEPGHNVVDEPVGAPIMWVDSKAEGIRRGFERISEQLARL
jgi:hypothetical protein